MKNLTALFSLLFVFNINAEIIRFRAPNLNGRILSESIDLTDWQAVMICHYNLSGKTQEVMKYPNTFVKKIDANSYSLQIKSQNLTELLPNMDILNCGYKMIIIGKNKSTHQNSFGELMLAGNDHGVMTDKEIENVLNKDILQKTLTDKVRELTLLIGEDGGIVQKNAEE
jgi:hypothetical protein